ncbi:MAG TPA: membrane-bound PQQ-dependent dehydrogenase, glucose/quinate/shikimate family, partial [Gammaproteobacteria bacterium]|nr:membrane-bound PQQ-dependent dehydrogenase, glucose/quinate/shikimate family [Gammaproteobacteria bacterium]
GVGMLIAAVGVARRRRWGAAWYGVVVLGTVIWTAYESGLDYWRWVPRFGLVVALAFWLALLLPRLDGGPPRRVARGFASVFAAIFIAAVALAFVHHGAASAAPAAPPVRAAAPRPSGGDWPAYGGSNAALRYSPLTQIDRGNVSKLERAWVYRTGDLPPERWGAETTPLEIAGTVYLCSARNVLIALDASKGTERWRYDPHVSDDAIPYTAACRGVAYYEAPQAASCPTRVIEGTLDGRLIAVDAATGAPCEGFGTHGAVDITVGMGKTSPGMVSINSPPAIVRGVIVTGHQVLDGQRRNAPSGVIQGFDAVTGELRWAWDMVHPERTGAPPPGETYARGTPNSWTAPSADEDLGLVYLPMGNSAVDYWSGSRTAAENEYSSGLVALDAATGRPAWHFQTAHRDVWDYDLGSQGTLVDFPTANGTVPAIIVPSKQGDIYILDRRTGEPLTPVEERPAPQGGVEPELRSPTQPASLYHTLAKPKLTERDMWGISPLDQLVCRIQFRLASYEGMYTPPTADRHFIDYSGYNGGSDWGGVAVDRERGVIIANYNDMPNYDRLVPRAEADAMGWAPRDEARGKPGGAEGAGDPQEGTPYAINVNAGWRMPFTRLLCKEPPYGGIRAIELATGRTLWDRPFGTARENGPFGLPTKLPIEIGTPNNGGSAITAGGLIFIAAATDNLFRAIDIDTGETVWQDVLPAGG